MLGAILLFTLFFFGILALSLIGAIVITAIRADECHIRLEFDGDEIINYYKDNNEE